jgi:hypothetical protein
MEEWELGGFEVEISQLRSSARAAVSAGEQAGEIDLGAVVSTVASALPGIGVGERGRSVGECLGEPAGPRAADIREFGATLRHRLTLMRPTTSRPRPHSSRVCWCGFCHGDLWRCPQWDADAMEEAGNNVGNCQDRLLSLEDELCVNGAPWRWSGMPRPRERLGALNDRVERIVAEASAVQRALFDASDDVRALQHIVLDNDGRPASSNSRSPQTQRCSAARAHQSETA